MATGGRTECNPLPRDATCAGETRSGINRPNDPRACYYFYYNPDVCEDQVDRNNDMYPDCLWFESEMAKQNALRRLSSFNAALYRDVPVHSTAPTCRYDQNYCSACDPYTVPDSTQGTCFIVSSGENDLQTFYTPACAEQSDCAPGAGQPAAVCRQIATATGPRRVCVPETNSCISG